MTIYNIQRSVNSELVCKSYEFGLKFLNIGSYPSDEPFVCTDLKPQLKSVGKVPTVK